MTAEYSNQDANRAVIRTLVLDVLSRGRVDLLPELIADDCVVHLPYGDQYGPDGVRLDAETWRTAFPDLDAVIVELLAAGEWIVRRFELRGTHHGPIFGIAPTGRRITVRGIAIDRLEDGRLIESWPVIDLVPLVRPRGGRSSTAAATHTWHAGTATGCNRTIAGSDRMTVGMDVVLAWNQLYRGEVSCGNDSVRATQRPG